MGVQLDSAELGRSRYASQFHTDKLVHYHDEWGSCAPAQQKKKHHNEVVTELTCIVCKKHEDLLPSLQSSLEHGFHFSEQGLVQRARGFALQKRGGRRRLFCKYTHNPPL